MDTDTIRSAELAIQPCSETSHLGRSRGCFHERQAKLRGSFAQVGEVPFSGPLFIVRRAQIAKRGAMGEEVIDDAREFMGGGDDGRFGALASPHPPVVGAQAIVAATDRLRRQSKRLAGAVAGLERAPA